MIARLRLLPALLLALGLATTLSASDKKFLDSDDAKKGEDPKEYLKHYDKLEKGKEADWVFWNNFDPKSVKTVSIKPFSAGKGSQAKYVADDAVDYVAKWIEKQKLPWEVVKSGGDLVIKGNVANAWEPSGAARFWGGWMANPGAVIEIAATKGGEEVFEMRHRARGSTVTDALENGIEKMMEEVKKRK